MLDQVEATPAAINLIKEIQDQYGPVIFHQSGGCCDGSSPMCFAKGEFLIAHLMLALNWLSVML